MELLLLLGALLNPILYLPSHNYKITFNKLKRLQGAAEMVRRRAHPLHLDGAARRERRYEKNKENQDLGKYKSAKICKIVPKYEKYEKLCKTYKICKNMQKYSKICKNMQKK